MESEAPSEWEYDEGTGIVSTEEGNVVAAALNEEFDDETADIHGRLIAAAPDLLAAALAAVAYIDFGPEPSDGVARASDLLRAAIAKATGAKPA